MSETKRCSLCGELKNIDVFYENTDGWQSDKHHAYCIPCHNDYMLEYYRTHRDERLYKMREYYRKYRLTARYQERLKAYTSTPEYREKQASYFRERYQTDPTFRANHLEREKKRRMTDPKYREKRRERNREDYRRKKVIDSSGITLEHSDLHEQKMKGYERKKERMRERYQTDLEYREKMRERAREYYRSKRTVTAQNSLSRDQ